MELSRLLKQHAATYKYTGSCWGTAGLTMPAHEWADMVVDLGVDDVIIDHPATNGGEREEGYYVQSGNVWRHRVSPITEDELVLERVD